MLTDEELRRWEGHARDYLAPGHEQVWAVRQLELIQEIRRLRAGITYNSPPAYETVLCPRCGDMWHAMHVCAPGEGGGAL